MDTAIQTTERVPLAGFLLRWLGAWMLATALSAFLLALFYVLEHRYRARPAVYLAIIAALSLPAVGGLLQGIVLRGLLRRATLWGALTGGGMVTAALSIGFMFANFRSVWWPLQFFMWTWIARTLWVVPPAVVGVVFASVVFGLILGAVQSVALGARWWGVSAWIATSIAAAIPTGLWLYAWVAFDPVSGLFARVAELMPLSSQWRYLPVSVLWAEVAALCFAMPTGLLMRQLLRRRQRADDAALVRRFE